MLIPDIEHRLRLTCTLPNKTRQQRKAFDAVINYIEAQRLASLGSGGWTQSSAFAGQWWDEDVQGWIDDSVSIVIVDCPLPDGNEELLNEAVAELKKYVHEQYEFYGCGQKEIWLIAHKVTRYL